MVNHRTSQTKCPFQSTNPMAMRCRKPPEICCFFKATSSGKKGIWPQTGFPGASDVEFASASNNCSNLTINIMSRISYPNKTFTGHNSTVILQTLVGTRKPEKTSGNWFLSNSTIHWYLLVHDEPCSTVMAYVLQYFESSWVNHPDFLHVLLLWPSTHSSET